MPERWVINASPTILLAKVGLISHVPSLTDELVIPQPIGLEILSARTQDAATFCHINQKKRASIVNCKS